MAVLKWNCWKTPFISWNHCGWWTICSNRLGKTQLGKNRKSLGGNRWRKTRYQTNDFLVKKMSLGLRWFFVLSGLSIITIQTMFWQRKSTESAYFGHEHYSEEIPVPPHSWRWVLGA
jgi:hypothetical protein